MSIVSSQPGDQPVLNPVIEPNVIENSDETYKVENSEQQNNFPLSEVSNDANAICYVNQDNTLSFINNQNVFQTVEDDCGEIYYACIGPNNNINQQDQVLQLIPQTQISNYIISDKDYPNVNFVNDSTVLNGNNFYPVQDSDFQVPKYQFDNVDSNVFKSINCIGKQICEVCSLEFPSKRTYLKHMSIHENDREFKCAWCKLSYNYEVNLLVHIAIIHSNECTVINESTQEINYKCGICSCLFSRKKAHQAHCLIHQVDEELPCEHCSTLFKCKILLEKHLVEHKIGNECPDEKLSINYLNCKICHQIFDNVGNIKKHYAQFHPKSQEEWAEEILSTKVEETIPAKIEENSTDAPLKRRSSKIACQTIKLYAQSKAKSNQTRQETIKSLNKRGRPKKSDSKSSRNSSTCSLCHKAFKTPILLRRHQVTHTGLKEFECAICKKGFTQKSSVKIHMAVHESEKGFSCEFCGKRFTYEHNMNTHIKVVHKGGNNVSTQCSDTQQNSIARIHPNDTLVEILECRPENEEPAVVKPNISVQLLVNASATDDTEITQYLWNENQAEQAVPDNVSYQPNQSNNNHYIPSKVDWDKSNQATENRGILVSEDIERVDKETGQVQVHEVIRDQVTGFKRFRCRFCFKLYRKSFDLTRHVRIHSQLRPFQCYMCHKSFRLKSVLKNHFKSHWKLKEYSCTECNKIFNLKQTLKVHQRLHNPEKLKYSCNLCDKRFNTAFHQKYHTKHAHRAEAESVPNDGNKTAVSVKAPLRTFMWNDLLNQPVPIPDPDKKSGSALFKCNHCGKSYKFKKYLNEHLKDHLSANKTNICHFCNKSFLTFRSMQQHLRTQHLNRRKFSCSQCPAFFLTKASLIRHGLVHSSSKPFACSLCFRRFKAKIYCDRHVASKKCSKKLRLPPTKPDKTVANPQSATLFNISHDGNTMSIHPVESSNILTHDQLEAFSSFRLEDLDMNNAQSSNILVTNYVNQFGSFPNSTDKYMIVSLDNQHEKDNHNNNDINQNGYYTSNLLIEDPSMVDINRNPGENNGDTSENIMGLLEGQIGVAPIDIGSIFTVQNYNGNIGTLSAHLVDRNAEGTTDIDYTQSGENVYYYQSVNDMSTDCQETMKTSLADKFPILKASLFSDDDLNTKPNAIATKAAANTSVTNNSQQINQFILSTVNSADTGTFVDRTAFERCQSKFYHGCANCEHQFKDSASLVQHVKLHHKIRKDFVCNVCHKAFSAKLSLWAHSKTHIDSRSFGCFVCIACNQRFISVPSLSRHVRMQHNDNLNLYRCTHCSKVYKTTRELDSHVKQLLSEYDALIINANLIENREANEMILPNVYSKAKVDIDVDIDKVYFSGLNSSQIDHIASLDVCNASKLSLKELIKVAKETKELQKSKLPSNRLAIDSTLTFPYSCSICHKGFNRASNLQQHLSVHTKMKPFQCSKCNNQFRHRCSLKTHETTKHNPVTKLLRCHLCLKFLRSQVALRNHMKIHVRSYTFNCTACDKGFQTSNQLDKHIKQKHKRQESGPVVASEKISISRNATRTTGTNTTAKAKTTPAKVATTPVKATTTPTKDTTTAIVAKAKTTPAKAKATPTKAKTTAYVPKPRTSTTVTARSQSSTPIAAKTQTGTPIAGKTQSSTPIAAKTQTSTPIASKTQTSTPIAAKPQIGTEMIPYSPTIAINSTTTTNAMNTSATGTTTLIATLVDLDYPPKKEVNAPEIPKKLIKCLSCSFIFNTKSSYDSHYCARLNSLKPDDDKTPNTCCNTTFESKSHLLRHIQNAHRQIVQYNCAQCNIMFAQESSYRNHQKSVHHL